MSERDREDKRKEQERAEGLGSCADSSTADDSHATNGAHRPAVPLSEVERTSGDADTQTSMAEELQSCSGTKGNAAADATHTDAVAAAAVASASATAGASPCDGQQA